MANEDLNPKMRRNPLWYQGWDYDDELASLNDIQGDINMNGHAITNLKDPQNPQDAVSKKYLEDTLAAGGGGGGGPINAAQVRSTGTGQIGATTVQGAIDEISQEAAFVDRANTFSEIITFNKAPQIGAGVTITNPQELTTLQKVEQLIAAIQVEAANVSVGQLPPLANIKSADVQGAIEEIDNLFGEVSDFMVESTSLVGTYNAATNRVLAAFGGATSGGIQVNQVLPTPEDENKGMYVLVTTGGTGVAPAPTEAFLPGDLIFSTGAAWIKIPTALPMSVINVTAAQVAFDNATAQLPNAPTNVQGAIESLNAKIPATVNATQVTFASTAGIQATNVAGALDELKTASDTFLTKSNGALTGNLNAAGNKIVGLGAPSLDQDAVNKQYADTNYVKQSGGVLGGPLNANNKKITGLATPDATQDAANKQYVDTAITAAGGNYVTKSGGALTGDLNAGNNKITTLKDPANGTDAANKQYVDGALGGYVAKSGGELTGALDANSQRIMNLPAPTTGTDAATKAYVDTQGGNYVTKTGGVLTGDLNAGTHKITGLQNGSADSDAINAGQLKAALQAISSQLVGKLTFIGTYDAATKQIASLSPAAAAFTEYQVGQNLPPDSNKLLNHFLIVTVAGTGTAPAPTEALKVGDLIYSSGGGWGFIPLGSTHTAVNIAVDAITQLPGVTNVQEALNTLAQKPITAAQTTFDNNTANLPNNPKNVQAAIQELQTQANGLDATYVKQTGGVLGGPLNASNQKITGLAAPGDAQDAANKQYVDSAITAAGGNYVTKSGGQLTGALDANSNQIKKLANGTDDTDAINLGQLNDAIQAIVHPVVVESLNNVDITADIASLAGKGTFTLSSRLLRDPTTKDTLSALFGMKLTLNAAWTPVINATPTILNGCQILGPEYFQGLPLPVDNTLTGGSFKTLAQIALIPVDSTGGVILPQNQTPIRIGRLVCTISSGNTQIYIVFNSAAPVPVPQGTGAFYVMRYEGLPAMAIL